MRVRATLVTALLILGCEDPGAPGEAAVRVDRYDLELDLRSGAARSTLTVAVEGAVEPPACFSLASALPLGDSLVTGAVDARVGVTFPLGGTSPEATASIPFAEPVTGVTVDPQRRVVDFPALGVWPARATSAELRWHP